MSPVTPDPRVELHAELRRAHTVAARALAAFGRYYRDRPAPVPARFAVLAMTVEGVQLLHAIFGRAEKVLRDELDEDAEGLVA